MAAGVPGGGSRQDVLLEFILKDEFHSLEGGEECVVQARPGFPESSARGLSPDVLLHCLHFGARGKKWVEDDGTSLAVGKCPATGLGLGPVISTDATELDLCF